jgi:predicted metalloprotease
MTLNPDARPDTGQVRDVGRRGGGPGGRPIPIPRGPVGLIVLTLLVIGGFLGGNSLLGDDGGDPGDGTLSCPSGAQQDVKCRNALYVTSIQNYWQTALPQSYSVQYQNSDTIFFDQAVNTGCGAADNGVGPFYCPVDDLIYIDVSFWNELATRFGAEGQFAQPYVLAHEYGHHVQDLLGIEADMRAKMQRDPANRNAYSVFLELQADCFAGVWARHATETTDASGRPIFTELTDADIAQALDAAAAVGDDAIQKQMGGSVDESKFTHGSSEQRQHSFTTGYSSGNPQACTSTSLEGGP